MAEQRPILVPLDGSKLAENALPDAAWLSRITGAPIRFIHVIDTDVAASERGKAAETFRSYTKEIAADHGLGETACDVAAGSAADEILKESESASAIVIATHGRGGFRAMIVGSVADKVIRGATVPVLAEPGRDQPAVPVPGKAIVVGLDGSPEAEQGLAMARELAAASNVPIVLVRAFSLPPPAGIEFSYYPADLGATLEAAAKEYLQATAQPGEKYVLMQGDAATAVLEAADQHDAGLIVLTSTGKGLAKRIALGSTTDRVVHSTSRSVLVVPQA
ncbi:MAG: universal stress protein [Dehalococcoidia bacterium]|nr:universal stress protein [Dehalococcoidia bacterium]